MYKRQGVTKASVIISLEEVDGINDKLKEIICQTQKSVDEDELTFKQRDVYKRQVMEFAQAYQQQDSSTMNSALKGIVAGVMMAGISTVLDRKSTRLNSSH